MLIFSFSRSANLLLREMRMTQQNLFPCKPDHPELLNRLMLRNKEVFLGKSNSGKKYVDACLVFLCYWD